MNTKDLIAMAKLLLEDTEPGGWKFARYDGEIIDPTGYIVAESVLVGYGDFIAAAPELVRDLVEALEAAVAAAELRREWSQYYSEKYQEAKSLNGRDPNEPR